MSQNNSLPLSNRVAVITGASSGIGEATAKLLASRGAAVALIARRKDRLDAIASAIVKQGGRALALAVDATTPGAFTNARDVITKELGAVDLVVNNAGVMLPSPVTAHRLGDYEQMIDLNVTAVVRVIDTFVDDLIAAAGKGGRADLVNISSIGASGVFPHFGVYCATKAAVTHLSKNLRTELGPKDVRVSVIEPGFVNTELQSHMTDDTAKTWIAGARETIEWLRPEDIAETIAFAAALPRHVTFQQLTILPTRQV